MVDHRPLTRAQLRTTQQTLDPHQVQLNQLIIAVWIMTQGDLWLPFLSAHGRMSCRALHCASQL